MADEVTTQHTVSTTQPAVAPTTTEQTTTTTTTAQPVAPADQTVNVNAPISEGAGGVTINVPATPGVTTTTTTATPQVNINEG